MESPSVALLGRAANETNPALAEAWCSLGIDCALVDPTDVRRSGRRFDAVVPRLDVLPTLDGVEPGLLELLWLERAGMRVLNPVAALLGVHDKLRTAVLLARAGIPHPKTTHLHPGGPLELPRPPVVLKPRFGSWGEEVRLCKTRGDIRRCLDEVAERG